MPLSFPKEVIYDTPAARAERCARQREEALALCDKAIEIMEIRARSNNQLLRFEDGIYLGQGWLKRVREALGEPS